MREQDEALVLATPLFSGLEREAVLALVAAAMPADYAGGELLFSQGDVADRFFLVLEGQVNLFVLTENGDKSIVEVVGKGETFAEAAMFASKNFPVNAEIVGKTRLLDIPARSFLNGLAEKPGLAAKLLASLALWQHRLLTEIADIKRRTPAQRVGLFLLAAAQPFEDGQKVHLPLSKMELASRIGVTPESLSRVLVRLRPLGVSTKDRDFIIADSAVLRRFCGEG